MTNPEQSRVEREAGVSDNLQFALAFAVEAGHYMVKERAHLIVSKKLDRTDVSNVDLAVNAKFEDAVERFSGGRASVIGEESSRQGSGSEEQWIIDPVDGTGEYIDDSLNDTERTSCVGISLLKEGEPQLSVVYNPFRDELFYAERGTGNGAYLNGSRLDISSTELGQREFTTGLPYDYCHWQDAAVDARFFEEILDRQPIGSYSAIYQACMVAKGESAFAVFPGNTIHDIAPAAFLVEAAGGIARDTRGNPFDEELHGAVYAANPNIHADVVRAIAEMQERR